MTRTKMIGFTALAVCVLGYGGFATTVALGKAEILTMREMLMYGVPAATIGEIGLWVAAASLGWSIFKGRKAFIDRVFRRKSASV